jgi:ABC-type sulfate transport system permease subunit
LRISTNFVTRRYRWPGHGVSVAACLVLVRECTFCVLCLSPPCSRRGRDASCARIDAAIASSSSLDVTPKALHWSLLFRECTQGARPMDDFAMVSVHAAQLKVSARHLSRHLEEAVSLHPHEHAVTYAPTPVAATLCICRENNVTWHTRMPHLRELVAHGNAWRGCCVRGHGRTCQPHGQTLRASRHYS